MSSKDADGFATSSEYSLILTRDIASNEMVGLGVTPEVYDGAVRALIDSDNLS